MDFMRNHFLLSVGFLSCKCNLWREAHTHAHILVTAHNQMMGALTASEWELAFHMR